MEKPDQPDQPQYTVEQMLRIVRDVMDTNQRLTDALSVALEFLPPHASRKVAEALEGKEKGPGAATPDPRG